MIKKSHLLLLLAATFLFACKLPKEAGKVSKHKNLIIAFGSCSDEDKPQSLWDDILADDPDLWIWLGDNVYADTENMDTMRAKYNKQKSNPIYQQLIKSAQIEGTWDDHDFGPNNSDRA